MTDILGTANNQKLKGTSGADNIDNGGYRVRIDAEGGNDSITLTNTNYPSTNNRFTTVYAGAGDDIVNGSETKDLVYAGEGNDLIQGNGGNDIIKTGSSDSAGAAISYGTFNFVGDVVDGGAGSDDIDVDKGGVALVFGGAGEDKIEIKSETSGSIVNGGDGNDTLIGGKGGDKLYGDAGDDRIIGKSGNDEIYGGAGNDSITGGRDNDKIFGDEGNDNIKSGSGDDEVEGADGDDFIWGGSGSDTIKGGNGVDTLDGDAGDDFIWGDDGNDVIKGGSGNDKIYGGAGNDKLSGNGGQDTFIFDVTASGEKDIITDFRNGDLIDLAAGIMFDDLAIVKSGKLSTITLPDGHIIEVTTTSSFAFDSGDFI